MATLPIRNFPVSKTERSFSEVIQERRATPSFSLAQVPVEDLAAILRAGMEAPSGYNLQPWRFVVVRDPDTKKRLRQAAMNQAKVEEAPVVIVACGDPDGWRKGDLDRMLQLAAQHGYGDLQTHEIIRKNVSGAFAAKPGRAMGIAPDLAVWLNRHVMIALTTMMWMAEVLGYDTAPMEGFFEDKVKAVLHIPESVRIVALLAIGKRKGADKAYAGRFEMSHLCFDNEWDQGLDLEMPKSQESR